jgi:hypothetical protein
MPGTIRSFLGFLICFGAVGGIEQSMTNAELIQALIVATVGLVILASGTSALSKAQNEKKF